MHGSLRNRTLLPLMIVAFTVSAFMWSTDQSPSPSSATSKPDLVLQTGHTSPVICIAFSPNGTLLASGGFFDNAVKLWEVETGRELRALSGHSSGGVAITGVTALAFSPDSQLLAAGSADGSVSVWDVQTGNEIHFISGASGSLGSIAG